MLAFKKFDEAFKLMMKMMITMIIIMNCFYETTDQKRALRVLTGKAHPKTKLKRLRKI